METTAIDEGETFFLGETPMKRLILVRHAEAAALEAGHSDFDRPLLPEGEKQADRMGKKMGKDGVRVDLLISSPAKRALETAHIFARRLNYPIRNILRFDAIYKTGEIPSLLQLVRDTDDRYDNLLMIGHNPSLSELAKHLVRDVRLDLPKAGAVRIEFSVPSWKEAGAPNARLTAFDIPGAVAKAEKWQKKIRRELTRRMVRQNLSVMEALDRTAAAKVAETLEASLKKAASRFVKEARNFSLGDVSWIQTLQPEPKLKAKPSPSKRKRAVRKPKTRQARPSPVPAEKQA
jgi:phosphohistidine phosphatase